MVLLVDIGNSNIVLGLASPHDNKIHKLLRLKTFIDKTFDEYYLLFENLLKDESFDGVAISSVVPIVTSALKKMFEAYYKITPLILGPGTKSGIMIKADDPRSVGADLICAVAGALIYSKDVIIVDLGTATKYIYAKDNTFHGVSIAPGIAISMKALVSSAALLPSIELQVPKKVLGNNTIACMQSGIIYGAAAQVDGMIELIKEEIKNPNVDVIVTGGLAKIIIPLSKHKLMYNENLVLEGLLQIYKKNTENVA